MDSNAVVNLKVGLDGDNAGNALPEISAAASSRVLPTWPQLAHGNVFTAYLGRTAVWQLAQLLKLGADDEVLAPTYNCGCEIDPLLKTGARLNYFRVDRQGNIDEEDLRQRITPRTRVVYVIHYFGWVHRLDNLAAFCRSKGIVLVEDCALSLFSTCDGKPTGTSGDAAIYSLRKFLPVPDGGLLTTRFAYQGLPVSTKAPPLSRMLRNILPLIKGRAVRASEKLGFRSAVQVGRRFGKSGRSDRARMERAETASLPDIPADYYLDDDVAAWDMSRFARRIAQHTSVENVCQLRRRNYRALAQRLANVPGVQLMYGDLPAGVCPAAMPVIVDQRSAWDAALHARGVDSCAFWEGYHRKIDWADHSDARFLKDHVLTLPIAQWLDESHMHLIADACTQIAESFARPTLSSAPQLQSV